jgi:hypothetical protein
MNMLTKSLGRISDCSACGLRHTEPLTNTGEIICPFTNERVRPDDWMLKPWWIERLLLKLAQALCWHSPRALNSLALHYEHGEDDLSSRIHIYSRASEQVCRCCGKVLSTAFYTTDTHVLAPYPNMTHYDLNEYERDMDALPITPRPGPCDFTDGEDDA